MPEQTHLSVNGVLRVHKTTSRGLTSQEAQLRLSRVGLNRVPSGSKFSTLAHFADQFTDPMIVILLVAIGIALVFGQFRDALVIGAIVLVNALIGFSQEFTTEQTLKQLRNLVPRTVRVWRDVELVSLAASQLVPGDVISLTPGDLVPADAYLISANELRLDEAALTGESLPVAKIAQPEQADPIFMGTTVRNGTAQAVVAVTGRRTRFGELAEQVAKTEKDRSPLAARLTELARQIGGLATIVFVVVFLYGLLTGADLFDQFFFALALAVAVVPEGLPATISVVLGLAARRLAERQALVKRLATVESLAAVTVICTDKTGTLTENQLTVDRTWIAPGHKPSSLAHVALGANNAHLDDDPANDLGDPLEIALARWAAASPASYLETQAAAKRLRELPFNEDGAMMSVIVRQAGRYQLLAKGAPEEILARSRTSRRVRETAEKQLLEWAQHGYRVLALAERKLTKQLASHQQRPHLERDLTLVGLVALLDPPRPDVAQVVAAARSAGIRIVMITGDNPQTATNLARRVGILRPTEATVISGDQLDQLEEHDLDAFLLRPAVFARINPVQKLRIINRLKDLGETVAVTGDGVNDGPALKRADVGIAMGRSGTDVARQASDIILLDDHFGTLVTAIEQSRLLYLNLKKTIWYTFAANSAELFTLFFGALAQLPLVPIRAIQILAVDLGTDILPSFALATDPAHRRLLLETPHPKDEPLLGSSDFRRLALFGVIVGLGGLVSFWHVMGSSAWQTPNVDLYGRATFAVYATIVLCQLANMFAARSPTQSVFRLSLAANPLLLAATAVALGMLAFFMYAPPVRAALGGGLLTAGDWLIATGFAGVFLAADELRKWLIRHSG